MEVLAQELAKILNITIEKAVELYPVLRQQFIIYKIANNIGSLFNLLWMVSMMIGIIVGIIFLLNLDYQRCRDDEDNFVITCKKIIKVCCLVFIVGIIGVQIIDVLQYVLASDFMIIKEML